jgi:hypothetical protein
VTGPILLVGPLGDVPWAPACEAAERLRELGCTVDAHDPTAGQTVIPYPDPYNPRNKADSFLPVFLNHRVRAFLRWRQAVRPVIGRYSTVVVWDPMIAVMLRLARPARTRIVWTDTRPVVADAWNAVLVRIVRAICDRVITAPDDDAWYAAVTKGDNA